MVGAESRSVRKNLNWINVLFIASAVVGILGAWEIAKGARLHELNFLHIKYNHVLHDAVMDFEQTGDTTPSDLKEIVTKIRQQPTDCLAITGALEKAAMWAAGTYGAIALCHEDIVLADETIESIDSYIYGDISKQEICAALQLAVQGFSDNSAAFEPLVTQTVNVVFYAMMTLIIFKSFLVAVFGFALSRDVARNYEDLDTAQKESEKLSQKLTKSRERFEIAVRGSEVGIWDYDVVASDVYYSGKVWEMLGYTLEEAKSTELDFSDRLHPDDRERCLGAFTRHMETGDPYDIQYRGRCKDGSYQWFRVKGQAVWDDQGNATRIAGSVTNIQELVESRQKAEEASKLKSEFLANMSHEIRTPMNGMLGMAQALQMTELSVEQAEMIDVISQSGDALLGVINDILDISKIEAGKLEIEDTDFSLAAMLETIKLLHAPKAHNKNVRFSIQTDASLQSTYGGDPNRITQVLNNLISNAIKFTDHGSIDVTVTRGQENSGDRQEIVFVVSDTGIGIEESELEHLFVPFSQEDASTTRRYGGTGLGLAICQKLVRLMGGWIEVKSQKGRGSTFRFGLCLESRINQGQTSPGSVISSPPKNTALPLRILAAEDHKQNQMVLKALLDSFGANLTLVETGQEAVDAWQGGTHDIILMDVQMPVMDGVEATRKIREHEKTLDRPRIPIVALTANAMTHQVEEYLAAGMDAHIAKPIQIEQLLGVLANCTNPIRNENAFFGSVNKAAS